MGTVRCCSKPIISPRTWFLDVSVLTWPGRGFSSRPPRMFPSDRGLLGTASRPALLSSLAESDAGVLSAVVIDNCRRNGRKCGYLRPLGPLDCHVGMPGPARKVRIQLLIQFGTWQSSERSKKLEIQVWPPAPLWRAGPPDCYYWRGLSRAQLRSGGFAGGAECGEPGAARTPGLALTVPRC